MRTLGEWGGLSQELPPRKWLLTRHADDDGEILERGVLLQGKVGLLVAAGGAGKTMLLIALALAVATGRPWLNFFRIANPGRVFIALGEEDQAEFLRRFQTCSEAMGLTAEQRRAAESNIVVVPLSGLYAALVSSDSRKTEQTPAMVDLRGYLSGSEWRLIILDPLTRFAGADTEKDTSAATRFIQAMESLVDLPGSPSVVIAHHTNKFSRERHARATVSNTRGPTALTDGGRWVSELVSHGRDSATLSVTKTNYTEEGLVVQLVRESRHGGYLRARTEEEAKLSLETARLTKEQREEGIMRDLVPKVEAWISQNPGHNKTQVAAKMGHRAHRVRLAVEQLRQEGRIVRVGSHQYRVTPTVS